MKNYFICWEKNEDSKGYSISFAGRASSQKERNPSISVSKVTDDN